LPNFAGARHRRRRNLEHETVGIAPVIVTIASMKETSLEAAGTIVDQKEKQH
jgi:hypothetical protein